MNHLPCCVASTPCAASTPYGNHDDDEEEGDDDNDGDDNHNDEEDLSDLNAVLVLSDDTSVVSLSREYSMSWR